MEYRDTGITGTTSQLATVTRDAFQAAVEAAAAETFESARLQELLYKPCTTRSPADVAETAHRLRSFKYFSTMDPSHINQLAAVAGACPCPRSGPAIRTHCPYDHLQHPCTCPCP